MDEKDVDALATSLSRAWQARTDMPVMPPDRQTPATRSEAYRVQDRIAAIVGQNVAGWKFGATSPAMRRNEGHSGPVVGRVFESVLHIAPTRIDARDAPNARIEGEFVFRYVSDMPPRAAPYTESEVAKSVVMHPGLEIIGNRYPKLPGVKLTTYQEIADNGTGWALVVGAPYASWRDIDVAWLEIDLRVNGSERAKNFLGDDRCIPLQVAVECANMLSERGIGIVAGQYLTTGGCTLPLPFGKGDSVSADFGPLGRVDVNIV